jgi:hypothetical protein
VFLPLTIASTWCQSTISGPPTPSCPGTPDLNYEVIGPQVFRFEYYYLGTNGNLSDRPCNGINCTFNGWQGVAAIVVSIAVIDPRSKVLLTDQNIATLNVNSSPGNCDPSSSNFLCDFRPDDHFPGHLINKWQTTINNLYGLNPSWPHPAISGLRVYERYFYLTH